MLSRIFKFFMGFVIIIMSGIELINQILLLTGHPVLLNFAKPGEIKACGMIPLCLMFLIFGLLCIGASFSPKGTDEDNKDGNDGDDNTG